MLTFSLILDQFNFYVFTSIVYLYENFLINNSLITSFIFLNESESILLYIKELKILKILFYSLTLKKLNLLTVLLNIFYLFLIIVINLIILYFILFKFFYYIIYLNFLSIYISVVKSFNSIKLVLFEFSSLKYQTLHLIYYKKLLNINIKKLLVFSGIILLIFLIFILFDISYQLINIKNELYNLNIYNQSYYSILKNNNFDYKYLNYIIHFCFFYILIHILLGFYMVFFDYFKEKAFILFLLTIIIIFSLFINLIIINNYHFIYICLENSCNYTQLIKIL